MLSASSIQKPYPNESIYDIGSEDGSKDKATEGENDPNAASLKHLNKDDDDSSDDDEDGDDDEQQQQDYDGKRTSSDRRQSSTNSRKEDEIPVEELMLIAGKILILHDELLHKVFSWLPVDAYATLALVSPHWKHLTRTEPVYKRLCERLYLNQSKRRQLHVARFNHSYRLMLELRPRVRAAGGCYVLKYAQIKQIQRDMFTEVPFGAVLESIYYRYVILNYALGTSRPRHVVDFTECSRRMC